MFVTPTAGLNVRYPGSGRRFLPYSGAEVEESCYWLRRIEAGDVTRRAEGVNLVDFGAIVGSKAAATTNRAALLAAMAAAVAAGTPVVFLPEGTVFISAAPGYLYVPASVSIVGRGKTSILRYTDYDPSVGATLVYLPPATDLALRRLLLAGPCNLTPTSVCTAVHGDGGGSVLTLDEVTTTSWVIAFKMGNDEVSPSGHVVVSKCALAARACCVLMGSGDHPASASFTAKESTFAVELPNSLDEVGNPQCHPIYLRAGVSFDLSDCDILSAGTYGSSYGLHHYGGAGQALYGRVTRCKFRFALHTGMISSALCGVVVTDSEFECQGAGVKVNGPILIQRSKFRGGAYNYGISDENGADAELICEDSEFSAQVGLGNTADILRFRAGTLKEWLIRRCQFGDTAEWGSNVRVHDGTVNLEQCVSKMLVGRSVALVTGGVLRVGDLIFPPNKAPETDKLGEIEWG